jgi:hypothetical protein
VAINASGRAFMTHFVVDSKFVIRMAVGGAMTKMRHVQDAWELVKEKAKEVGALPTEYVRRHGDLINWNPSTVSTKLLD